MSEPLHVENLDSSFGVLLIGALISGVLFGMATVQWYWYHLAYPNDNPRLKMFVAWTWIWELCQQALISHTIYFFLIENYFNPVKLDYHVWSLCWLVLPETIVCASVQGFFTYRIWRSSRSDYKAALVIFPSLMIAAKFALGITYCVKGNRVKSITQAIVTLHPVSLSLNALAAAADLTIAFTMTLILHSMRSGFSPTNNALVTLMVYTVNTGVITSVAALVTFIVQSALYNRVVFAGIYFITSKLYLNTMLASLNSRERIANKLRTEYHIQSSPSASIVFVHPADSCSAAEEGVSGVSYEVASQPIRAQLGEERSDQSC